jgi:hypothetical protein
MLEACYTTACYTSFAPAQVSIQAFGMQLATAICAFIITYDK